MAIEKAVWNELRRFAGAFREARDRGANESDTVMYLVKFFEILLGYDSVGPRMRESPMIWRGRPIFSARRNPMPKVSGRNSVS